jgi:hypothetical protein
MPPSNYIPFDGLDESHRDSLTREIRNILGTELALSTYAQILDGLPSCDMAREMLGGMIGRRHPIKLHLNICPGVMEQTREIRAAFDNTTLRFNPDVCYLCIVRTNSYL